MVGIPKCHSTQPAQETETLQAVQCEGQETGTLPTHSKLAQQETEALPMPRSDPGVLLRKSSAILGFCGNSNPLSWQGGSVEAWCFLKQG